jgi:hypothetical protein
VSGRLGTAARRAARAVERALPAALLCLAVGACAERAPSGEPEEEEYVARYDSQEYGFSIAYPDTLDRREYSAEHLAVGRTDEEGFAEVVTLDVHSGTHDRFETFAADAARLSCATVGPDIALECTEVEALQPFTSRAGARGSVLYLRHVASRTATGEIVEAGGRGPFFAFELPAGGSPGDYRALVIGPAPVLSAAAMDTALVRTIAESLRLR